MSLLDEVRVELRKEMTRQGLTQADVANRLGMTRGAVNQVLVLRDNVTLRTLETLAAAVGCELEVRVKGEADAEVHA